MKVRSLLLFGFSAAAILILTVLAAQPQQNQPTREMMRVKLEHAQSVLEGITMSDFALIRNHAAKLGALSEQPGWRAYDTPEYAQQSLLFKRTVDSLLKAGREENLEAATLAYTKMTFSCVECHRYLRGRTVAEGFQSTVNPFQEDL